MRAGAALPLRAERQESTYRRPKGSLAVRLAVILVHYHSPALVDAALAALRADLQGSLAEVEWLVVDNGSDPAERRALERLDAKRIDPGANLGYAGGLNLGVAATTSDLLILMNPDVLVLPGCLPALIESLSGEAAIAGPRFFWDGGRRMLLPPLEAQTRRGEVLALLASRSRSWARRARKIWRRHARRHWQARLPLASYALSGSLLALRRSTWDEVGPFDDRFKLFFEETDWLFRAKRSGVPAFHVPAAQAVHLHAQSTIREPRSQQWFEESARRFRRLHHGRWFTELLEGLDQRLPKPAEGPALAPRSQTATVLDLDRYPSGGGLWIEVSPNPTGVPAAAERLVPGSGGSWTLPSEIVRRLPSGDWWARVVDQEGNELATYLLRCGEGSSTFREAG
jgi:N-acetylglucosaminyl-diphospho-decaprenol L-rhamnosyltransferase